MRSTTIDLNFENVNVKNNWIYIILFTVSANLYFFIFLAL